MNILYVEDDLRDADLTRREFAKSVPHFRLDTVATQREALARLEGDTPYDLVLTDLRLPDGDGLAVLAQVRERALPLAVVVITGGGDEESAVAALKAGADDYVVKGGDYLARLPLALENALRRFHAEAARRTHPLRVLYAEHHASDVDLTRRHLARHAPHIHLEVAHSAFEVFQRLSKDRYDLLLLDYHLPGMNGLEVLKELAQTPGFDLPVVLVTGRGDEEVAVQALRLGAADYLVKNPGYLYQLPSVLENAFHRAQLVREQAALRKSEERYRAVVEYQTDLICRFLPDGTLTFVNESYCRYHGKQREDLVGHSLMPLILPEDREKAAQHLASFSQETPVATIEYRVVAAGGKVRWQQWINRPIFDEQGSLIEFQSVGRDVTERVRAEEALRESEERYRDFIESTYDIIQSVAPDGRFIFVNRAWLEALGYTEAELPSLNLWKIIHSESLAHCRKTFSRVMAGESIKNVRVTFVTKDGRSILVEGNVTGRYIGDRFGATHGFFRDITERKRAEEALKEAQRYTRGLIEASLDALVTISAEGKITDVNRATELLTGISRQEIIGTDFSSYFTDPDAARKGYQRVFRDGYVLDYFLEIKHRDGKVTPVLYNASVYRDAQGHIAGVFAAARDITERKRAEEEQERLLAQIRVQARQVQQIIATVPEGILLLNAAGRVILANPVAEQDLAVLAGVKVGDTLTHLGDRPLAELLTSPPTKGLWHEVTTSGSVGDRPERMVGDRPELTFEVITRPVEDGAEPQGWVLVIRDVTQEREIQQRVEQQERLAAVGQLAAGIAHDFNNIMGVIVLYSQISQGATDLPPKARERLETIDRQAQRASDLIAQVLDFSRRSVLERRPLDLGLLVKEQVKLLERTLPENIQIRLAYGKEDYTVKADLTRMQQIIMNLALNARDAMLPQEEGELRITLSRTAEGEDIRCVTCGPVAAGPEEWVKLEVADSGTGIPADVLPHIFEPFSTTKERSQGTGLGLAQVHGIVSQHEGHINVTTRSGEGTTFTVYLPALSVPKPSGAPARPPEELTQGQGETILVVEDNPEMRRSLVESLAMLNYRTLEAANGREALESFAQHADDPSAGGSTSSPQASGQGIALVLSDLVMPVMGGRALFHALKQQDPAVKVVLLTGHPMQDELEDLAAQGLSGWLLKPPHLEQLAQTLARALLEGDIQF